MNDGFYSSQDITLFKIMNTFGTVLIKSTQFRDHRL